MFYGAAHSRGVADVLALQWSFFGPGKVGVRVFVGAERSGPGSWTTLLGTT
jgi:hypothetical protein